MTDTSALFNVLPSTTCYTPQSANNTITVIDPVEKEPVDLTITFWQRTIADRIKEKIDQFSIDGAEDGFRSHLGWSVIGHDCLRYLWYHWHWFWKEEHSARMERIFLAGHQIEAEIRHILKALGVQFLDTVDENGQQIKVSDIGGHFGGSVDGVFIWPEIGLHMPTLLECKSSKTGAPFNDLAKLTVGGAKPRHFIQQSGYGKHLNIKFACYICRNKNDSSLYVEIVELDWDMAAKNIEKAKYVMTEAAPPPRISNKPNFWVCNMCAVKPLCHLGKQPVPNCRNCKNSTPVENAGWHCNYWNALIPKEAIIKGCEQHKFLPY